jgi:DNA-binding beta-propeller fold protein YncE
MTRGATSPPHPRRRQLAAPMLSAVAVIVAIGVVPASATTATVSPANSVGVGLPPVAIAVDAAAHTAYATVSDGTTNQVVVINTAKCTAKASAACSGVVTAVTVGAGADGLAYDAANHTLYVAESDSDPAGVALVNTATCNATTTTSCGNPPVTETLGLTTPGAIAVDTSGGADVFYVTDLTNGTVTVGNGASCNATKTSGCTTLRTATVGAVPDAIAIDSAVGTAYVANLADDSVTLLNETACSKLSAACATAGRKVPLDSIAVPGPASPTALVADPADNTVFIADSGTGDVSFLNTAKCTIATTSGCSATPRVGTGLSAAGIALTSQADVAVADSSSNSVVSFGAATCDATTTTGCTSRETDPLGGSPTALATNGVTIYAAVDSPASVDIVATPSVVAKVKSAHAESAFGWYRSPVTVTFTCTAGTASLTRSCHAAEKVTKNTKGRTFSATLTSADGGSVSTSVTVRLDRTKPIIKITGVKNGKTYPKHPSLHCVATDALSGLASCHITLEPHHHHHLVDYVGKAVDKAGNVARTHGLFKVS